jgi:uncharacterized protein (DUF1810 family)
MDKDNLDRFLQPQEITHSKALMELRTGLKLSHWIWWELPQLRGLGKSQRAHDYGLIDLDEAGRYLGHPLLGMRLLEMFMALLAHRDKSPEAILGPVDAMKLRSCATVFARVPGAPDIFQDALDAFFGGQTCLRTDELLDTSG